MALKPSSFKRQTMVGKSCDMLSYPLLRLPGAVSPALKPYLCVKASNISELTLTSRTASRTLFCVVETIYRLELI